MAGSILTDTKTALGLAEDYTAFDAEITMHINSVFADLNQLGIGADEGFEMANAQDTWDELIGTEKRYNSVKSYVYLRVRMLFDPPSTGYVLTSMEKLIKEHEWRINIAREEIVHPPPPPVLVPDEEEEI
jgi:hypothetical protein